MQVVVAKQFDRAASSYQATALVQRQVAQELVDFLPENITGKILEVGCGTGSLTTALQERYFNAEIDAVDISSQMILQAKKRVALEGVSFYATDILDFRPAANYQLITSSASLQWIKPLEKGLVHLRRMLSKDGSLIFSIMTGGTLRLLYQLRAELFPESPGGIKLLQSEELEEKITASNLLLNQLETRSYFQPLQEGETLFSTLKQLGVTASASNRRLSRGQLTELLNQYQQRSRVIFGQAGIEYEVAFCKCSNL